MNTTSPDTPAMHRANPSNASCRTVEILAKSGRNKHPSVAFAEYGVTMNY